MVARAVVGVQSEVIEKHGYKGDAGFAQVERHPSEISTIRDPYQKKKKIYKKRPIRDPYHQRPLPSETPAMTNLAALYPLYPADAYYLMCPPNLLYHP